MGCQHKKEEPEEANAVIPIGFTFVDCMLMQFCSDIRFSCDLDNGGNLAVNRKHSSPQEYTTARVFPIILLDSIREEKHPTGPNQLLMI